jgi:hypothetical protein
VEGTIVEAGAPSGGFILAVKNIIHIYMQRLYRIYSIVYISLFIFRHLQYSSNVIILLCYSIAWSEQQYSAYICIVFLFIYSICVF